MFADRPPTTIVRERDHQRLSSFVGNNALWTAAASTRNLGAGAQVLSRVEVLRNYRVIAYGMQAEVTLQNGNIRREGFVGYEDNVTWWQPNQLRQISFNQDQLRRALGTSDTRFVTTYADANVLGGAMTGNNTNALRLRERLTATR